MTTNNINIFGKGLFQSEYHILKRSFEEKLPKEVITRLFENENEIMDLGISPISVVEEMAKEIRDNFDVVCNFYQWVEDVPNPRELSSEKKIPMVFDDLFFESYLVRGRHRNADCFYLDQNYFKLNNKPNNQRELSQTIRENANFICLFPKT